MVGADLPLCRVYTAWKLADGGEPLQFRWEGGAGGWAGSRRWDATGDRQVGGPGGGV